MKSLYRMSAIFAVLLVILHFSCPTPKGVTRYYSDWAENQYFFQYDITHSGSITYDNNSSVEVTRNTAGVWDTLGYSIDKRLIRSRYNVTFDNTDFGVTIYLNYYPDTNTYKMEYTAGQTRIYFATFEKDYERQSLGTSYGWNIDDSDITITADGSGNLQAIHLDVSPTSGFDFSGADGDFWDTRNELVKSVTVDLDFTRTGYIVKNTTTTETIDDLRFFDSTSIIKNVPGDIDVFNNPETELVRLVTYLVSTETDAGIRMKIINDWIADNIQYDLDAYYAFSVSYIDNLPYTILKNRYCVCQGFSRLFVKMCEMAGIDAKYVHGKSRSKDLPLGGGDYGGGHAWNMVQLNGQYYIIDVTSNQTGKYENGTFTDSPYYNIMFLVGPEDAIYRRWPSFNQWQALTVPIDDLQFQANPYDWGLITHVNEYCYSNNISFPDSVEDVIDINNLAKEFDVSADCELLLSGCRYDAGTDDWVSNDGWGMLNYQGANIFKISLFPAETGQQIFYLFQKDPLFEGDTYDGYKAVAGFRCNTTGAYSGGSHSYPKCYTLFSTYKCQLAGPLQGDLQTGNVTFDITVAGIDKVGVWYYTVEEIDGATAHFLTTDMDNVGGDQYQQTVNIPAEAVIIHLGLEIDAGSGSYYTCLRYYGDGTSSGISDDTRYDVDSSGITVITIDENPFPDQVDFVR